MRKKIFTMLIAVAIVMIVLVGPILAARGTIYLPVNQEWVYRTLTRSGNYSYLSVECLSVYPVSGTSDPFERIQVKMTNTSNVNIAVGTPVVLKEGEGMKSYYLREGYYNTTQVRFHFRGNSSNSAYTEVVYLAH